MATWLVADMQESRRGYQASFDHGWFVLSFFFVYVPYYLFATRRRRGLLILAGVGVLFLLPQLAELVVWSVS